MNENEQMISYEGGLTSQMEYGLPGTWALNIELMILQEVLKLAKKAGVRKTEFK